MHWLKRIAFVIAGIIVGFLIIPLVFNLVLKADTNGISGEIIDAIGFENGDTLTSSIYYNQLNWKVIVSYDYIGGGSNITELMIVTAPKDARMVLAGRYVHIFVSYGQSWIIERLTTKLPPDAPIYRPLCTNIYVPAVKK